MTRDDISYHFQIGREGITTDLISSWPQVWESIWNHRYVHAGHGRLANALLIITIYIGSKGLLDILNAIVFSLFIFGISMLCLRKVTLWSICIVISMMLFMLPFPDRVLFWASAAYNYLWGGALLVWLLYLLRKQIEQRHTGTWTKLTCTLLAFLCGWIHEALGLPLICGLVLFVTWRFISEKKRLTRPYLYSALATCVGSCLILSAPAFFARASSPAHPALSNVFENIIFSTGLFIFNCKIGLIIFLLSLIKQFKRNHNYIFWICLLLPNLVITCRFGLHGSWGGSQFYPMLIMMLFVLDKWGESLQTLKTWIKYATSVLLVANGMYFFHKRSIITDQNTYALRQSEFQDIVCIDGYSVSNLPDWVFYGSLPCTYDSKLSSQLKKLYHLRTSSSGKPNFVTIFNIFVQNKNIYDQLLHYPNDTCQIFHKDSTHYIRLPKGYMANLYDTKQYAITNKGNRISLKPYWFLQARLTSLMNAIGKQTGVVGEDYHHGFYYIVLPDEQSLYTKIHVSLINLDTAESTPYTISLRQ